MVMKQHIFSIGETVNDTLVIVNQVRHGKRNSKAYEVQSVAYPTAPTYIITEEKLKTGRGDSYLAKSQRKRIFEGNSLFSIKEIRHYLTDIEQAKTIAPHSNDKIKLKCPECFRQKEMTPNMLLQRGFSCHLCSKGTSYPELFFMSYNIIKKLGFEYQVTLNGLSGRRGDFYNPDIGLVETNGMGHYKMLSGIFNQVYENTKISDNEKKEYCRINNITFIEIDCRESSFDYIKNSINACEFLPNISKKDEVEILKQIEKNKRYPIKKIIDLYKNGSTTYEIADKFNISRSTVCNILRKNNVDTRNPIKLISKKIKCLNNGKTFDSISEASRWCGLKTSSPINAYLKGKTTYTGRHPKTGEKLHWELL